MRQGGELEKHFFWVYYTHSYDYGTTKKRPLTLKRYSNNGSGFCTHICSYFSIFCSEGISFKAIIHRILTVFSLVFLADIMLGRPAYDFLKKCL